MCHSKDGIKGVGMMIFCSLWVPGSGGGGTTRQPSWPILAMAQYRRTSVRSLPDFLEGCLPVFRWLAAMLHAALASCAAAHDFVL